jgi:hypothetical protein
MARQGLAHLVFTDDERFTVADKEDGEPPPLAPLEGPPTAVSGEEVGEETIRFRTSRPGQPVLIKVSYHPRWRAEGADGPYLVSPALMMVVPRQTEVRLVYARTASDDVGLALTIATMLVLALWARVAPRLAALAGRVAAPATAPGRAGFIDACDLPPAGGRRWGGLIPAAVLLLLALSRWIASAPTAPS